MSFFKGFAAGFKDFGHYVTNAVNFFLLIPVYLLGIGLPSLFGKIVGKHFLETKVDKKKKSYWKDYSLGKQEEEYYYRQF